MSELSKIFSRLKKHQELSWVYLVYWICGCQSFLHKLSLRKYFTRIMYIYLHRTKYLKYKVNLTLRGSSCLTKLWSFLWNILYYYILFHLNQDWKKLMKNIKIKNNVEQLLPLILIINNYWVSCIFRAFTLFSKFKW